MLTTKLINSVASEDLTTASECLEHGGNPNTLSGDGATAMHIAAGVGVDAVRLMLSYGGDPNVRSVDGSTPLHVAAAWGDRDTLRLLLHNGANPNLIDHDGQRAVDVARSEDHAACVDFLKYYTMLVAVGDEEEGPMYTSELIDPTQEGSSPHSLRRDHTKTISHQSGHFSDEEEPASLSDRYTDALSRRLSQLLTEKDSVCLDVTSPDCPYIGDKSDRHRGAAERTLRAENAHHPDLSDSDSSGNDLPVCEMQSGCRCHSNHCCIHNQPKQRDSDVPQERPACCKYHCTDSPAMPEYQEAKLTYARKLERKMKRKYFPDFAEGPGRDMSLNQHNRSGDTIAKNCSHSYFTTLSPKQAEGGNAAYVFHHAQSSGHRKGCQSKDRAMCTETGHCQNVSHFCDQMKSSPCCCSHITQKLCSPRKREQSPRSSGSHSPLHEEHWYHQSPDSVHYRHVAQKQPGFPQSVEPQRSCHLPVRRLESHVTHQHSETSPQTSCSCRSLHDQRKGHSIPSCSAQHHQLKDDPQKECCCKGHHHSTVSQSLRSQATYSPTEEKSHVSASSARPPVTILHVQEERFSSPPGVFYRTVPVPFIPGHTEFTSVPDGYKQQKAAAGSCSSHSVDSGFCEKCTTNQQVGADVGVPLKNKPTSTRSRTEEFGSYMSYDNKTVDGVTGKQMAGNQKKVKSLEKSNKSNNYMKFSGGKDSCQLITYNFDSQLSVSNGYHIVSSNLTGRNLRQDLSEQSKHAVYEEKEETRVGKGGPRHDPMADLSESSSDSFQTCEEASVQETTSNTRTDQKHESQLHSKDLPHANQEVNVSAQSAKTAAANSRKQEKIIYCTPDRDPEVKLMMESFGFNISEMDGKKHDQKGFSKIESTSVTSKLSSSSSQPKIGADFLKASLASVQRSLISVKDESQCKNHYCKSWLPPSGPLPDDSDLLTSDGSFMAKAEGQKISDKEHVTLSSHLSRWLQNVPAITSLPKPKDIKQGGIPSVKRMSDETVLSVASSVQEYLYHDKENGIILIERHIPSEFSGSSGRPSLDGSLCLDIDATVSYDWTDFTIHSDDLSSSSSSAYDINAGHTLKSEKTLNTDKECCSGSDKSNEESEGETWQEYKRGTTHDRKNANKRKPVKMPESSTKKTSAKNSDSATQQIEVSGQTDSSNSSNNAAISAELESLSNLAIYQSLKDLGEDPGPVLPSTRQTYLQLLANLQCGKQHLGLTSSQPGYSSELNQLLSGSLDMEDLAKAELSMVAQFQTPDGRTWREGTIKSCFNYLLLDPRVTRNLPLRAKSMSDTEAFKIFLSAVFYIGKGKRSRPYCHLYEAISQQKVPKLKVSQKVQQILDIWFMGLGVVSLHCFQNVIPVEAYTREACMVDAMGLGRLTNVKKGDYYGVASTWSTSRRRCMGAYLLRKAFQIFLSEGERQICPLDIQKGK